MINNKIEYIICSAIHFNDEKEHIHQPINISKGFVISGRRHHNIFSTISILNTTTDIKKLNKIQGFLTNYDRFVDRIEAADIAIKSGQIESSKKILYSEDIY